MRRREFITLLAGAAALPFAAQAEDAGRTYRLGIMTGGPREAPRIAAFFDEFKVFGFTESQNLTVVAGGFGLRRDQFAEYARTLVKSNPDVVVSAGQAATRAAKDATQTIPVVGQSADMVAAGLVRSFARPGGNITGISIQLELDGKRQDMLIEAIHSARHIAMLVDPTATQPAQLEVLENAARTRGVEAVAFTAATPPEIAPVMDKAKAWGAEALNVLSGPMFSFNRRVVIEKAAALRLPAIYEWPDMAEEGGLIGYGPSLPQMWRQTARLAVRILRGAKPEDIPVEQPAKFELVVNLATAKALDLAIPETFLARADKVIE
jgi:putative tryptophan/tyrosine transport system substrate-binding protein